MKRRVRDADCSDLRLRETYRRSFISQVHTLIAEGHERLPRTDIGSMEEPAITGELVRAIRQYQESSGAPAWCNRLAIHDDPPVNLPGRTGTRRPRVDIEVERCGRGRRPRFQMEAKRLYSTRSAAEYTGDDGLGSFVAGRYAAGHTDAGMLGYAQCEQPADWAKRIGEMLSKRAHKLRLKGDTPWEPTAFDTRLQASYRSSHRRNHEDIDVFHILLDCR